MVDQRGASIACWMFMPKSITFISVCMVRMIWSSPPGLPVIMKGWPSFITSVLCSVLRGRLPGVRGWPRPA